MPPRDGYGPALFLAKGRETKLEVKAAAITVGTSAGCDLVLRDPIAASEHCRLSFEGGQFWIEDAGSVTGTFRNGAQVAAAEAIEEGDEIIVGVSRLVAALGEKDGLRSITLTVKPRSFRFFEIGRKTPPEDKLRHDRDLWARTEVGLGRFGPLRSGNFLAVGITGALIALLFVGAFRDRLIDPGPLSGSHAQLFAGSRPAQVDEADFAVAQKGCDACHASFRGAPSDRCQGCHADMMAAQHPFQAEGSLWTPNLSRAWTPSDCSACHQEHLGPEARQSGFLPSPSFVSGSCEGCHRDTVLAQGGFAAKRELPAVKKEPRPYSSFEFGHDDHVALRNDAGEALACTVCHERDPEAEADAKLRAGRRPRELEDYRPVPFEACARCHAVKKAGADAAAELDPKLRGWWPRKLDTSGKLSSVWTVAWHGTDSSESACKACHTALYSPDLKSVARIDFAPGTAAAARARYRLGRRSHGPEFQAHAKGACEDCHRRGSAALAGGSAVAAFWHAAHVDGIEPSDAGGRGGDLRAMSKACLECHSDRSASMGLLDSAAGGPYRWAPESCSAECHREIDAAGQPVPLRPAPVDAAEAAPAAAPAPAAPRSDFPHALHLDFREGGPLADGCFSCHEFVVPQGQPSYAAIATTKPEKRECTACHAGHAHVGGGDCVKCHPMEPAPRTRSNVYLDPRSPPAGRLPSLRDWPERNTFSHFSEGHVDAACDSCHRLGGDDRRKDLSLAADLATVPVPDEADPVCRKCHLEKRQRYHWR